MDNHLGKPGGTQTRSDCYKHLSLSFSLSSFWLCSRHKASFHHGTALREWADLGEWQERDFLAPGVELLVCREGEVKDCSPPYLLGFVSVDQCWGRNHVLWCPLYNLPFNTALQSCFCGNLIMQLPWWITVSQVFPFIFFEVVEAKILCFCALCVPPVDTRSSELHHLKAEAFAHCKKRTNI